DRRRRRDRFAGHLRLHRPAWSPFAPDRRTVSTLPAPATLVPHCLRSHARGLAHLPPRPHKGGGNAPGPHDPPIFPWHSSRTGSQATSEPPTNTELMSPVS